MDAEKNVRLNFSLAEVILRGCFLKTIYSDMRLGEKSPGLIFCAHYAY